MGPRWEEGGCKMGPRRRGKDVRWGQGEEGKGCKMGQGGGEEGKGCKMGPGKRGKYV